MRKQFTLGQQVVWQSQAAGVVKTKRGTIEQVVPAGARPDCDRFAALYRSSGVGAPRDHVSYVVRVEGKTAKSASTTYWPRTSALTGEDPAMTDRRKEALTAVARAICAACGEQPDRPGDARGNRFRWQDYENSATAAMRELKAAAEGEPGRSAISHLAAVIALSCDDGPDLAWRYEQAAGDALRAYAGEK